MVPLIQRIKFRLLILAQTGTNIRTSLRLNILIKRCLNAGSKAQTELHVTVLLRLSNYSIRVHGKYSYLLS